ncbi:MAG: DUF2161 family putative PD-(D/E)XK-type phosphodiesterase [Burkholderiaceae bacterium]
MKRKALSATTQWRETDLYPPVKSLLQAQGYEVKSEIHQCDVVAIRGTELPVVVELKLSLNISLLLQAVDRFALTDKVYLAVPLTCPLLNKKSRQVKKLIRMLGLGLICVDPVADQTTVMFDPAPYQPRKSKLRTGRLLGEFDRRIGDPNSGGADRRRGLMTAYRQRALRIATHLGDHGKSKASIIASALDEPKTRDILYNDVYGWFDRHGGGHYSLSPRGREEITQWITRAAPRCPPARRKLKHADTPGLPSRTIS